MKYQNKPYSKKDEDRVVSSSVNCILTARGMAVGVRESLSGILNWIEWYNVHHEKLSTKLDILKTEVQAIKYDVNKIVDRTTKLSKQIKKYNIK